MASDNVSANPTMQNECLGEECRWLHRAALVASFALPLGVYVLTACRTVYWGDTGEFLVASIRLGIPHSPGTPLYPLIGRCFSLFSGVCPAFCVNLMSAFFASVSSLFVYLIVINLCLVSPGARSSGLIAGSLSGSLMWAFTQSLWSYATVAEVYTLQMAFLSVLVYAGLRLSRGTNSGLNLLPFFFFLYALSLANNVTLILLSFAFGVLIWRAFSKTTLREKAIILFLVVLGLTPYLYLPIRSMHSPAIDWGNPETLQQFAWVLTAREFARNMLGMKYAITGGLLTASLAYLKLLLRDMSVIGLALSGAGALASFLASRKVFAFLVLLYACNLAYSFAFGADLELDAYLLPSLMVLVLFLGIGAARVASVRKRWLGHLLSVAVVILPVGLAVTRCSERDLSHNRTALNVGCGLLSSTEERALFFTENTVDLFVARYAQSIEGFRPDLTLVYLPYLHYSWYRNQLSDVHHLDIPEGEDELLELMKRTTSYYTPLTKIGIPAHLLVPDGIRFRVGSDSLTSQVVALSDSRFAEVGLEPEASDYDTRRHVAIIHSYLGEYYYLRGRPEISAREYREAARIMPDNCEIQLNLAASFEKWGALDKALSTYQRCLAICGKNRIPIKGLGRLSLKLGNIRESRDYLMRAACLDPQDAFVFYHLGLANMRLGDYRAAAEANLRAIELQPLFPEALVNLGVSQLNLGEESAAVRQFERAIAADPSYVEAYLNLASYYVSVDSVEAAVRVLRHGLNNASQDTEVHLLSTELKELLKVIN